MDAVARVEVHESAAIAAPAAAVWDLIDDWAGMLRWWLPAQDGGLPGPALVRCDLAGKARAVPRARVLTLDDGAQIEERVIYQDDPNRRIHYTKSDDGDVCGYLASTYVDAIDEERSTVHIASRFDVLPHADAAAIEAKFELIYQSMFAGYERYLAS